MSAVIDKGVLHATTETAGLDMEALTLDNQTRRRKGSAMICRALYPLRAGQYLSSLLDTHHYNAPKKSSGRR